MFFLERVCKIFNLIFEKWLWPRTVCRTSHRKRQPLKDWEKVELSKRDLLMSFCWIFLLSCLILSRWIINGNGYFTLSSYLTKQINYGNTSLCWAFFIKHSPSFPSTSTLSSVKCACGISPVTRQWTRQFEFVCLKIVRNSKLIFYRTQVYLGSQPLKGLTHWP